MKKEKLYIAYGSNINIEQMKHRCPTAKTIGTTKIKDYELLFRGSKTGAYATIEPCEGSFVPALIWSIEPKDEIALDRYEGYPTFYEKEDVELELNGERVEAFVYVMTEGHKLGIPAEYYLDTIKEGYLSVEFQIETLENALEKTREKMETEPIDEFEYSNEDGVNWW